MKILYNPDPLLLQQTLERPRLETAGLNAIVRDVFDQVERSGDEALFEFTRQFDGAAITSLRVPESAFDQAEKQLSAELKAAIRLAAANIRRFHTAQQVEEQPVETSNGITCWRRSVPVQSVGLYIPGGTAPLFSTVLMLGIPAAIAGCPKRILCTPPANDGAIHPAILFAAWVSGIDEVYKVGGAQAIAAMALGTESIPKVDKLFGPGNQYVTSAKQFAQQMGIAIDLPAGPSEVLVAADDSVPAVFIGADLLAQAEHGTDSQVVFLTDSAKLARTVELEIERQLADLPRAEIAKGALKNSVTIVTGQQNWTEIINAYAPEHLILMGKNEQAIAEGIVNAGSIFIGMYSAESFGDYASGTNHTLPTAGLARAYSGVSLDSFVKKITYQRISKEGLLDLGPAVMVMAAAEELDAHKRAVEYRIKTITS